MDTIKTNRFKGLLLATSIVIAIGLVILFLTFYYNKIYSATTSGNPLITNIYTADPAPLVDGNTFYIYCGRDEQVQGASGFVMREWHVLSSNDMANWTDNGAKLRYTDFSWAIGDAWAGECIKGTDGKYYWYVPVNDNAPNGWMSIGVAVADNPLGPFKDAKGTWLVNDSTANSSPLNIDPTVFVDDDGQVYMYWGSYYGLRAVKLKSNMIELDGSVVTPQGASGFWEAPFLWKRNGIYYLAYAAGGNPATIQYCTSNNPMGPWTHRGMLCDTVSSPTNHPGVAEFNGQWYYVYHNAGAPGGGEFRRSVCIDYLYYNSDGTIKPIVQTTTGVNMIGNIATTIIPTITPTQTIIPTQVLTPTQTIATTIPTQTIIPTNTIVPTSITTPTSNTGGLTAEYNINNDWGSGATVNVEIANNGSSVISNWSVSWTFSGNQQIVNVWCGKFTQSGQNVTVTPESWNSVLSPGSSTYVGFNIVYSGSNTIPSNIVVK